MSLFAPLEPYKTPITLILVVFGPTLLNRALGLIARRSNPSPASKPRPPLTVSVKLLLSLHSVYWLSQLLYPPYDIFASNRLPITVSNSVLRRVLLGTRSEESSVYPITGDDRHPLQELLLQKLQNFDTRLDYARYGHSAIQDCLWCIASTDYLLAATPGTVAKYILEAVFIGCLSWKSIGGWHATRRSERWRGTFGWTLAALAVAEVGVKYFWQLQTVKGDCLHLSSVIHTARTIVLLALPIIYTFLPIPPTSADTSTLIPSLVNAQSTLRLTTLARAAIGRDPRTRRVWANNAEEDARAGELARKDHAVAEAIAQGGIDVPQIQSDTSRWLREGWRGLIKLEQSP